MVFGSYVAFKDETDPGAELIAMSTAMATSTSKGRKGWKATTPVQKLNRNGNCPDHPHKPGSYCVGCGERYS